MLRNSLLVSLALFPVLVLAASEPTPPPPEAMMVSTPPSGGNVVNMEDIQAQTMLYQAQLLRDKALVELQKLGSDGDSRTLASAPLPYDTSASQSAAPAAQAHLTTKNNFTWSSHSFHKIVFGGKWKLVFENKMNNYIAF